MVATVEGTAHHLVKCLEYKNYRNPEWKSMCEWYDRDVINNVTAGCLGSKLDNYLLTSSSNSYNYKNLLTAYRQFNKTPVKSISYIHVLSLFLGWITDP